MSNSFGIDFERYWLVICPKFMHEWGTFSIASGFDFTGGINGSFLIPSNAFFVSTAILFWASTIDL